VVATGSGEITGSARLLPSLRAEVGESGAKETDRLCGRSTLSIEEIETGDLTRATDHMLAKIYS
jgi:hypothetical protein